MCRTMNELEKVIADYRGLKAMKEQLEEELKICPNRKEILDHQYSCWDMSCRAVCMFFQQCRQRKERG